MIAVVPNVLGTIAMARECHSIPACIRMMQVIVASASFASRNGAVETTERNNQSMALPDVCTEIAHVAHANPALPKEPID